MFPVYDVEELRELLGIEEIGKEMQRPWARVCMFFIIPLVIIKEDIKQLLHTKVKRKKIENERQK
ncbi:hypothetical protein KAT95_00495 [Candidatus Parcubacteria bacterium]|nr:hypothetical protein [Candidatus Parcubacteria bacterium]